MTSPFVSRARQVQSGPIVPLKDGQPPAWVVACLDCGFSHDAHGRSADDAVKAVAPSHEPGHKLIARAINYESGWGEDGTKPHPLYSA